MVKSRPQRNHIFKARSWVAIEMITVSGWCVGGKGGGEGWVFSQWGRRGKTSVQTFSSHFLKKLTEGAVTTEAGSLFQYFTTLTDGSHLGVPWRGALLGRVLILVRPFCLHLKALCVRDACHLLWGWLNCRQACSYLILTHLTLSSDPAR